MKSKNNFIIKNVWAFCAVGEDGDEGVPVMRAHDGTWHPLIGADEERMLSYKPVAQKFANDHGQKVILKKFTTFEVVEVIEPDIQ